MNDRAEETQADDAPSGVRLILSNRDCDIFLAAMENPAGPNAHLRQAAELHARQITKKKNNA